jgi:hypothetical protein
MLLFHSTPGKNSLGIHSLGICLENARSEPRRIWLHSWRKRKWARLHLAVRYKCDPRQISSFALDMPRAWLTQARRGIWVCQLTIHSNRLIGQTFFLTAGDLLNDTFIDYNFDIFSPPGQVPSLR